MSSVMRCTASAGSASSLSLIILQRISYGPLDVAGKSAARFGSTYILFLHTDVGGISLAVKQALSQQLLARTSIYAFTPYGDHHR